GVAAYVDGCLNVAAELEMIDRPRSTVQTRYVVEDARRESGHLQIQHPAPVEGFFESAVVLGQAVAQGETLGVVVDLLGSDCHEVQAAEGGMVLLLRTFPRVALGDTLAVILPTSELGEIRIAEDGRRLV